MDYEKIMSDRSLFNSTIYTNFSDALKILDERKKDTELIEKVNNLLKNDLPDFIKANKKYAVHFRQIATPNYDAEFFLSMLDHSNLEPVFFEYFEDKFTSNNSFKHSLGQLRIHDGVNKNGDYKSEKITIVDFNEHNGKKLHEVKTLWDESLTDFHHNLFDVYGLEKEKIIFYNASPWLHNHGANAKEYYKDFFLLFIKDGILFENFLMDGEEGEFTKNIVLPTIEYLFKELGLKPLIVPIPPMEIEDSDHWISYHPKIKDFIKK